MSADSFRILDRTALKMIAVLCMATDHVGDVFFPEAIWMRCVGRLAMPIFCFFVAEGCRYTAKRGSYLLRMGIFAIISELPFDLAFWGVPVYIKHQNVMLTFFFAIAAIMAYEGISSRLKGKKGVLLGLLAVAACGVSALLLRTDYDIYGVGMVFGFYILKEHGLLAQNTGMLIYQLIMRGKGVGAWAMLSTVPLMMYNGKKGRPLKMFFYCFYPGHLLLIWLVKVMLK